jgi:serine phosphatase RsbU (regulator of sigma subunit)/ligand-binding sensor domain-containing protein
MSVLKCFSKISSVVAMRITILNIVFFLFVSAELRAQNQGIPLIRNYNPEEYKGYVQNWCAAQDSRGVMYFGNGKGILEYNGRSWRRFFTDRQTTVLSMANDSLGKVYIGAEGEIGYLDCDSTGLVIYKSLLHLVPENERNFSYVWHVYPNYDGVYFVSPQKVIRINGNDVNIFLPEGSFFTAFLVDGKFYIQDSQRGLLLLENNEFVQKKGWDKIGSLRFMAINKSGILFGISDRSGMVLLPEDEAPQIIETELNRLLSKFFYKGLVLGNDYFALATQSGGVVFTNSDGKILDIVDKEAGLLGDGVYALYKDAQEELWLMLSNGLSRIEINGTFSLFNEKSGYHGACQAIERYGDSLVIASLSGLYILKHTNKKYDGQTGFELVNNASVQSFSLTEFNKKPLLTCFSGIYLVNKTENEFIFHELYEIITKKSNYHKNTFFVGASGSFKMLKYKGGEWIALNNAPNIKGDVYYIAEENINTVWLGTANDGVFKISFGDTVNTKTQVMHYDSTKGLPNGMIEVAYLNGDVLAGSLRGLYWYNPEKDLFEPATHYGNVVSNRKNHAYVLSKGNENEIWLMINKTVSRLTYENSEWKLYNKPFKRLKYVDLYSIYSDKDNIVWLGTTDGIFRYNPASEKNFDYKHKTIINRVVYHNDTLHNGCFKTQDGYFTNIQPPDLIKEVPFSHFSFIFEYAATSFDSEEENLYSYILEGFDENWSDWSTTSKKEYTNIPEGDYVFNVKSMNVYGTESEVVSFRFLVLPPWYRTLWAYALYFLGLLVVFYILLKINTHRLRKANIRLEKIVSQRTEELRRTNQEILQQKEEITAQRDEIEAQRDHLVLLNEEINQQKEEIEAQRDEIELHRDQILEQKKELTDSIQYAKIIQTGVMPPLKMFEELFPNSFIIFKPKDIVSGDFYWFAKFKACNIVAAVDCTGHGVPGAFMSMLGISFLNEIVQKKEITLANQILIELRKEIINALQQSGESGTQKDGMDLSLISINNQSLAASWAGANNPLWIIKNSNNQSLNSKQKAESGLGFGALDLEFVELKGDKMPVGIYYGEERLFTNHAFELQKHNRIYLFSDGFPDQFGGTEGASGGKKFKYSNFKKLICETTGYDIKQQKSMIEKTMMQWMNPPDTNFHFDQIDDILIIGIEI